MDREGKDTERERDKVRERDRGGGIKRKRDIGEILRKKEGQSEREN